VMSAIIRVLLLILKRVEVFGVSLLLSAGSSVVSLQSSGETRVERVVRAAAASASGESSVGC
jgi:hypothetical protein